MPAIICDTTKIDEGDILELDLSNSRVLNKTKGIELAFPRMSKTMEAILNEGGLLSYVEKYGDLLLA